MQLFGKEIEFVGKYESDLNFFFFEANENFIVYRSEVSIHTSLRQPDLVPTVHLVFVGAMYFELLDRFETLVISKANDCKSFEFAKNFDKGFEWLETDERVYKIKSNRRIFYLVAAHIWIHEHNCQYRDSFVKNFNYDNYLEKYVKNWKKIE